MVFYIFLWNTQQLYKCCCGCGKEVVTPFSPTDWKLTFDGKTVSLSPSIGNWNFKCQSHYWITNDNVVWAAQWTNEQITKGRDIDQLAKDRYHRKSIKDILKSFFKRK